MRLVKYFCRSGLAINVLNLQQWLINWPKSIDTSIFSTLFYTWRNESASRTLTSIYTSLKTMKTIWRLNPASKWTVWVVESHHVVKRLYQGAQGCPGGKWLTQKGNSPKGMLKSDATRKKASGDHQVWLMKSTFARWLIGPHKQMKTIFLNGQYAGCIPGLCWITLMRPLHNVTLTILFQRSQCAAF